MNESWLLYHEHAIGCFGGDQGVGAAPVWSDKINGLAPFTVHDYAMDAKRRSKFYESARIVTVAEAWKISDERGAR